MTLKTGKKEAVQRMMLSLGIEEKDLVEKFILGSGRGGQKIQKTSSCVYLKHLPTGIEVKCQRDRSREVNRYVARRLLCEALREKLFAEKSERQQRSEKIRRQKRTRTRKQKRKMLEGKRLHGAKKALRSPTPEE